MDRPARPGRPAWSTCTGSPRPPCTHLPDRTRPTRGRALSRIGRPLPDCDPRPGPMRGPVPVGVVGEMYVGGPGVARATSTGRSSPRSGSSPTLRTRRVDGSTAAATSPAGCPTGPGVPRPGRRPGQDPGLPGRAGRDRGGLAPHPAVRGAAVVVRGRRAGRPAARRVRRAGAGTVDAGEVRERSPTGCPTTWCPAAFVALDAMPLTANGKVDRRGAAGARLTAPARGPGAPHPGGGTARCGLFAEVLGCPGRHRRQLLRPRRRQHHVHPAGQPGPAGRFALHRGTSSSTRPSRPAGRRGDPGGRPAEPRPDDGGSARCR